MPALQCDRIVPSNHHQLRQRERDALVRCSVLLSFLLLTALCRQEFDELAADGHHFEPSWEADEAAELVSLSNSRAFRLLTRRSDLYTNQLRGTIPTEVGRLTSVYGWFIYDNLFDGTIPTEVVTMPLLYM